MDHRLVAWARAVKARRAKIAGARPLPVLWLFTDLTRLADPTPAVARLPRGLCGVVLRHDPAPGWTADDRAALGRRLARICRRRRLTLVVAGDWRLAVALGAGLHLRGGRRSRGGMVAGRIHTASAHGAGELVAARRAHAELAFLSPAFPTASHPGAPGLGPCRWGLLAGRAGLPVGGLGGVDGRRIGRLPPRVCIAAGAIGGLT